MDTSPLIELIGQELLVLIDIGASDKPPDIWRDMAGRAVYVGFDPDARQRPDSTGFGFAREIIVDRCVVPYRDKSEVDFYLTKSPYCSSALEPDARSLSCYMFSHLFEVSRKVSAPVTTIAKALEENGLVRIDWFKTDSQGLDLQLYKSVPEQVRDKILAVDVEPGLLRAYKNEDMFSQVHEQLLLEGFWLSRMDIKGARRGRLGVLEHAQEKAPWLSEMVINATVRVSPGWGEARYLRSAEWLIAHDFKPRDWCVLALFALMDGQFAYTLDLCAAYKKLYGEDEINKIMLAVALQNIHSEHKKMRGSISARVLRRIQRLGNKIRGK